MKSKSIKIAVVGVGNCASALLQGIEFYKNNPGVNLGLMHYDLGGYTPSDIEVVAAFDIDKRKVGKPLEKAVFAPPNCTRTIWEDLPNYGITVSMGRVLDGVSEHMSGYPPERTFLVADEEPCDAREVLKKSKAEILLNYLPVGSQEATEFYAGCCLNTGVSLINCIPVFIASHPYWSKRFEKMGIPIVGDDVKSQLGATITHRALTKLFQDRGVKLERTYQLNTGGNTDFLNMLNQNRLNSKKISKTEAVQSQLDEPLAAENIHIGPSDYIPWQNDNKVCFIRMEGMGFAGVPLHLEMRLSVEDSPNSGGVTIDAIRYCKIARESGDKGVLLPISAYAMKHPPKQIADSEARALIEKYITEYNAQKSISSPLTLLKTY
ncbi:MAG: inositol-3-phosphate synthase [Deltaproteobacteria bacterium CG12_big_fil_rev_8_21_14_0_65_43_10]|nr:MAG: inositol-3-phosphate synthase [Deltaproteobacteria bacterium CG2_30_43_15]PIQ45201.1 MAG: inositol-3-phosphate synthase [Deltaproteobacteria bacterium CG12_big_fil_rev_8_21_14_0_65_43_10]PIU85314.1 MAG: inositol-3-phosphate synthase [Deltaproteobacteria bacterium CG06_land_8_20_14_3_00_44_19]PIX22548.1 MAG: inositol-3-phosphate synthase [Deltaproteobacteria bacterium CG_4_8_14_3_um_filter_43_13]PIZ20927.1 MAG: inositol-3-phosphate synthase [Deltaproteobacteria bacterium CG_4_10_14_0_8_u